MDDYMEMDVEIIDNRRGAIEVLNNLWSFGNLQTLRLENCLLEDEDLARIRYEAPKVSYICLRENRLHSPWNCLVNKFPNVIFLDLTQNTDLILDCHSQFMNLEELHISESACTIAINDVKRLFPKLIVLNNTQLFELSDGRARSTGGNDACDPPAAVRTYACRLTGMNAKDEKLINLPEELVSVLVDFLLEGLGIGQPELEATIESLKLAPTEFFLKLGPNDRIREQQLIERKTCRAQWSILCRKALGRAL